MHDPSDANLNLQTSLLTRSTPDTFTARLWPSECSPYLHLHCDENGWEGPQRPPAEPHAGHPQQTLRDDGTSMRGEARALLRSLWVYEMRVRKEWWCEITNKRMACWWIVSDIGMEYISVSVARREFVVRGRGVNYVWDMTPGSVSGI